MLFFFKLAAACSDTPLFIPSLYKGLQQTVPDPANPGQMTCQLKLDSFDSIKTLLINVVQIALALAGILAVGFIIFGAVQFIMSQGEPDRIKKGKETMVNAVVGLFLAVLAFIIVGVIANIFSPAGGIK